MLSIFMSFLMGLTAPSTSSTYENCTADCTEESHACESNEDPGPGDIGYVPPKK